jgi:septal ring factor EnvC (AmiA/AmiB activator)
MVKRAHDAEQYRVQLDRDGYEKLYRAEKEKRQLLEEQLKQLREDVKETGKLIDAYVKEISYLERSVRLKDKQILELLGQQPLIK